MTACSGLVGRTDWPGKTVFPLEINGKLETHGIITTERDPSDGRKLIYSLTAKGIDLAPVLTEMVLWAAGHEDTANQALVRLIQKDKEKFLAAVWQRWAEKRVRSTAN